MKKKSYSLTAKERKQLRTKQTVKSQETPLSPEETASAEAAVRAKKKNLFIMITAIVVGVLLILTAILLPIFLSNKSKYPVAKITFTNGQSVRMEIWEETCPIAATNFIFLARAGFFDGTLIYDAQNDFMRFGEYTGYKDQKRTADVDFIGEIKNFLLDDVAEGFKKNAEKNKFGYRLKADSDADKTRVSERGAVSFNYNRPADFVINLDEGNSNWRSTNEHDSTKSETFNVRAFGKIFDEDVAKLVKLYEAERNKNPGVNYYQAIVPELRIKTVGVSNLNKDKWNKKFQFVTFMNGVVDNGAFNNWYSYN